MSYLPDFRGFFAPASRLTAAALVAGTGFFTVVGTESAQAIPATATIDSVTGIWTSAEPGAASNLSGVGTNRIKWGKSTGKGQSAYKFTGNTGGPYNPDELFNIGTFTHKNNPVTGKFLTGATLKVDFEATFGGTEKRSVSSTFAFVHEETPNYAKTCAYGGANGQGVNKHGCADRVVALTVLDQTDEFVVDGIKYIFEVSGFLVKDEFLGAFLTKEKKNNTAYIQGRFTASPSQVPLPAAAWLLVGGIGALGAASRKRRTAVKA